MACKILDWLKNRTYIFIEKLTSKKNFFFKFYLQLNKKLQYFKVILIKLRIHLPLPKHLSIKYLLFTNSLE